MTGCAALISTFGTTVLILEIVNNKHISKEIAFLNKL